MNNRENIEPVKESSQTFVTPDGGRTVITTRVEYIPPSSIEPFVDAKLAFERYGIAAFDKKCRAGLIPGAFKATRGQGWRAPATSVEAWCVARSPRVADADETPHAVALAEMRARRARRAA